MPDTDTYGEAAPVTDEWLPVGKAAKHLGVSVPTLQRWDREGRLPALRTITNQRRYKLADLDALKPRES